MATTPVYALPYPVGTDLIMNGDDAIRALAERVEALIAQRDAVPSGRRNVLRNPELTVWQRGVGPTGNYNGAIPLLADGWCVGGGGGTPTHNRVTRAAGAPGRFAYRIATAGQAAAVDYTQLLQKVEGAHTLNGQRVTLSFTAGVVAGAVAKIAVEIQQNFGAGGSAGTIVACGTVPVAGAAMTRYALTFDVPSLAGKIIGTAGDDFLLVALWLSAGTNFDSRTGAMGVQNGTVDITDVQLEAGDRATPFERLSQQQQLADCYRYFRRYSAVTGGAYIVQGLAIASTTVRVILIPAVTMRVTPTVVGNGGWAVDGAVALATASGPTLAPSVSSAPGAVVIDWTTSVGMTLGGSFIVRGTSAPSYMDLSAEL